MAERRIVKGPDGKEVVQFIEGGSKDKKKKKDPRKFPLGSGMADYARRLIMGRQKSVDDAVDKMSR